MPVVDIYVFLFFIKRIVFFSTTTWQITLSPIMYNYMPMFFAAIGFKKINENKIDYYEGLLYDIYEKLEKWIRRKTASKRFYDVVKLYRQKQKRIRQIS